MSLFLYSVSIHLWVKNDVKGKKNWEKKFEPGMDYEGLRSISDEIITTLLNIFGFLVVAKSFWEVCLLKVCLGSLVGVFCQDSTGGCWIVYFSIIWMFYGRVLAFFKAYSIFSTTQTKTTKELTKMLEFQSHTPVNNKALQ